MDTPPNADQPAAPTGGPVRIKIRLTNKPKSSAESSPGSTPSAHTPIASSAGPLPMASAQQPTASLSTYLPQPAPAPTRAALGPPPAKKARNLDFTPSPSSSPSSTPAVLPAITQVNAGSSAAPGPSTHYQQITPAHISTTGGPIPGLPVQSSSFSVPGQQPPASTGYTANQTQSHPPPAFHPPLPPPSAGASSYRSSPVPPVTSNGGGSSMGGSDRGESPDPSTGKAYAEVPAEYIEGLSGRALVEMKRKWRKKAGVLGPGKNWRKGLKKGEIKPESTLPPPSQSTHSPSPHPYAPPTQSRPLLPPTASTSASASQSYSRPVAPPAKYSTSTYLIPDPLLTPSRTPGGGGAGKLRVRHWGLGRRVIRGVGGGTWGIVGWMGEEEDGARSLRERAGAGGGGGGGGRERERGGIGEAVRSEAYLAGLRNAMSGVGAISPGLTTGHGMAGVKGGVAPAPVAAPVVEAGEEDVKIEM